MFGKKKEQPVETNGIVYRRAKTWRVALAGCSSGIGMCFYVLSVAVCSSCRSRATR